MAKIEEILDQIENAVAVAQSASWCAIYPRDLLESLPYDLTEKQIKQHMDALCKMGRLFKVGRGAARGYRQASNRQRAAFAEKFGLRPRSAPSISPDTELVYEAIEAAIGVSYRSLRRGVLPRDIQPRLPWERAEGSLRRDMLAMYQAGRIVRVGGHGARQGYRLPTRLEKLAYRLNSGMWPYGTEFVRSWAN